MRCRVVEQDSYFVVQMLLPSGQTADGREVSSWTIARDYTGYIHSHASLERAISCAKALSLDDGSRYLLPVVWEPEE